MPENIILAVKNLVAGYGETEILHDINVKVSTKEIVSIIGPNGAGKSTVMKAILGILDIKSGNIILDSDTHTLCPVYPLSQGLGPWLGHNGRRARLAALEAEGGAHGMGAPATTPASHARNL